MRALEAGLGQIVWVVAGASFATCTNWRRTCCKLHQLGRGFSGESAFVVDPMESELKEFDRA